MILQTNYENDASNSVISGMISEVINGRLKTLVGSLFTAITNAIRHRLITTVNMNLVPEKNRLTPGWEDRVITAVLHHILDASLILPITTDVGDYLAGVIDDAIGGVIDG